jgi:hypothetical protein
VTAPGRHAANNSSLVPSGGSAAVRGAVLIIVAVLIGAVLLAKGFDNGVVTSSGGKASSTTPTSAGGTGTTPTTASQPHPANQVKAYVLNGSGQKGVATTATNALNAKGYTTIPAANAPGNVPATIVYFMPGYEADAGLVAATVGAPPTSVKPFPNPPPFDAKGAQVVVVLGPDAHPAN